MDLISRQAAIDEIDEWIEAFKENGHKESAADAHFIKVGIGALPSAQPYTEEEIQAMQDLEQAQLDKAYQIGVEEGRSAQPEIIHCKDCVKHNKGHGYYLDGTVIGIKDCCPLVEIRGMAQGHEFDYQYCAYAERRQDD